MGGLSEWSEKGFWGKSVSMASHKTRRSLYTGTGAGKNKPMIITHVSTSCTLLKHFVTFYLTIFPNNNRILSVAALMRHNHLLEKCPTCRYGQESLTLKRLTTKRPVPVTSQEMLSLGVSLLWNFMEELPNIHLTLVTEGPIGLLLPFFNPKSP